MVALSTVHFYCDIPYTQMSFYATYDIFIQCMNSLGIKEKIWKWENCFNHKHALIFRAIMFIYAPQISA